MFDSDSLEAIDLEILKLGKDVYELNKRVEIHIAKSMLFNHKLQGKVDPKKRRKELKEYFE